MNCHLFILKKPLAQLLKIQNDPLSYSNTKIDVPGFLGGAVVKNPPANAGDTGSSPGPGRSHMPRSN